MLYFAQFAREDLQLNLYAQTQLQAQLYQLQD